MIRKKGAFIMRIKHILLSTLTAMAGLSLATSASAGTDAYIGEVYMTGYTFCPRGTASAEGQLLAISQNTALFSLYGTTFGGDGRTTFGLPDLRGRSPMGQGSGPGLTPRLVGQKFGTETNTMTIAEMPSHAHPAGIRSVNKAPDSNDPRGNAFTITPDNNFKTNITPTARFMHANTVLIQNTGGNLPQNNIHPVSVMRYCVVLTGIFPSRS